FRLVKRSEPAGLKTHQSAATRSDPEAAHTISQQAPNRSATQFRLRPKWHEPYPVKTGQAIIAPYPEIAIVRLGQSLNRILGHALLSPPRIETERQRPQRAILGWRSRFGAAAVHKIAE